MNRSQRYECLGAVSRSAVRAFKYAILGALLSWSFTTVAVGAKNVMSSVPRFVLVETAFTIVQWLMVAPLTVLASRGLRGSASTISVTHV